MVGAEERRKLNGHLGSESISPLVVVLKCAGGILALVIVTAGPWSLLSATGPMAVPATSNSAAAQPQRALPQSVAESKRVFDERRQRYVEAHPDSQVASEYGAVAQWQGDANSDAGLEVWRTHY